MMKRIFMLMALALMLVAAMALSGVAQAHDPNKINTNGKAGGQCKKEAASLGISGDYNFIGGSKKDDVFDGMATDGADVFCGFGGNDSMVSAGGADDLGTLDAGDVFLGGAGDDTVGAPCTDDNGVNCTNAGNFYGGDGNDSINGWFTGTFYGGDGIDYVLSNAGTFYGEAGNDNVSANYGTVYGGEGDDVVGYNDSTFYGGEGNDTADTNVHGGRFYGEAGNDNVNGQYGGYFDGGDGIDTIGDNGFGTSVNVP